MGLKPGDNQLLSMGYDAAIAAVEDGSIDLAVFVAPINAPYLERAFRKGATGLVQLDFTEAISRNLKYAKNVTIPAGASSLAPVVPVAPRQVLAMEASLVITDELHPALTNRLTMAAIELHGARGIMADGGMFPSVDGDRIDRQHRGASNRDQRAVDLAGLAALLDGLTGASDCVAAVADPVCDLAGFPVSATALRLYDAAADLAILPEVMALEQDLAKVGTHAELDRIDDDLAQLSQRILVLKMPHAYRQVA